jgi:hypothetical protein
MGWRMQMRCDSRDRGGGDWFVETSATRCVSPRGLTELLDQRVKKDVL